MHILLININPVVSRLISLCVREDNIDLEEVENVGKVSRDKYDIVFVDEASYVEETEKFLETLIVRKKVFLSSSDEVNDEVNFFDSIIKKPFLPSQIAAVLESVEEDETSEPAIEFPSIFPLSSDIQSSDDQEESIDEPLEEDTEADTKVLDLYEIDKIKALLDMKEEDESIREEEYERRKMEVIKQQLIADGLEIIDEDEYVETLSKKAKKQKSDSKKNKKKKEETFTFEEALIAAIEGMKVKKIKKLLKGAEITIKINFKDKK